MIKVSANSLMDNTPLAMFELERSEKFIYYAILLDPPVTAESAKRIVITCERTDVWNELISQGHDEGSFNASRHAKSLILELIAPPGQKWKALHPAPVVGDVKVVSDGLSRVTWTINDLTPNKYTYRVFMEGM
jgi:hypothetical protein